MHQHTPEDCHLDTATSLNFKVLEMFIVLSVFGSNILMNNEINKNIILSILNLNPCTQHVQSDADKSLQFACSIFTFSEHEDFKSPCTIGVVSRN
jgi:hypothetical protein